ncbi:MAG TPA: ATP-binding cassette domain-containing protein, partial [Flexilinea sp.]|nr:ATP-binding cassette domain-containing protein [Flexilinea sp.]
MEEPIISIRNVYKYYKDDIQALRGVSLDVYKGEVVMIIGPSGSGKSTLLRSINNLEDIDFGEIIVDGLSVKDHKDINKLRMEVGMVFQQFNLFPHLSVLDNVMLAQKIVRKRSQKEAYETAMLLLEKVGIPDKASAYPLQLSGGQQQRVAVARALINRPAIVFADEPTGNLDSANAQELHNLFFQLREKFDQTFLIVTHN